MVRRFFSQCWLYLKAMQAAFDPEEVIFTQFAMPLLTLILYVLLASFSFNTMDLQQWVLGNAMLMCALSSIAETAWCFQNERWMGRLRSIIVAPANKMAIIMHHGFFGIIFGILSIVVGFVAASFIFSVDLSGVNLPLLFLTVVIATFSASGFGVFLSVVGLLTDGIEMLVNIMLEVLLILTGANFPISQLPRPVQVISWIFPLTHSIEAGNILFKSGPTVDFTRAIMIEILIGLMFFLAATLSLESIIKVAKRKGSLEIY